MSKLFTVAGTSTLNGKSSYRFANSLDRAKVLARNGHEHVELFVLPEPMTKEAAVQYLKNGSLSKQLAVQRVEKSAAKQPAAEKPAKAEPKVVIKNPRHEEPAATNADNFVDAWFKNLTDEQKKKTKTEWSNVV